METVRVVLDAGAEPDGVDSSGRSLLHYALAADLELDFITRLLDSGLDATLQDSHGWTVFNDRKIYLDLNRGEVVKIIPEHEAIHPFYFIDSMDLFGGGEYLLYVEENTIKRAYPPEEWLREHYAG